ncbi:MAG: hypothetical protein ABGZ17_32040 [Planctomycetaceae bacterium]
MKHFALGSHRLLAAATVLMTVTLMVAGGLAQQKNGKTPKNQPVQQAEATSVAGKQSAANLFPNGNFQLGKTTPVHWQTIDGLSTFWVQDKDPRHGKVLKFDTDVLQSQAYQWWVHIADGVSPQKAPPKIPTTPPKFDTLAGLDGVWFWSDPIPIEKNKQYWLTLDAKGLGMLVWLVGYPEKPDTSFAADAGAVKQYFAKAKGTAPPNERNRKAFIHKYVWKGQLKIAGSREWQTFSRRKKPFHPTKYTPTVKYVRVLLYPFWPPGEYYVDNVKLVEYDESIHGQ